MKVYHVVYEPDYKSLDVHFWLPCNLKCRACYTRYETLDFGLFKDPIKHIASKAPVDPPDHFYNLSDIRDALKGIDARCAVFMGTEPALDPEMPYLAEYLKREKGAYNIMLTNGLQMADLNYIDELIFSLKAFTPALHRAYTGRDNSRILRHFSELYAAGQKLQAETVLIPGLIEADEIEKIAQFVASVSPDIILRIDAYFPVGDNIWRAASRQEVEEAVARARRYVHQVSCLTLDMQRMGKPPVQIL